jgi:hypothetical protein
MFFLGDYAVMPVMMVFLLSILVVLTFLSLDKIVTHKSIKIVWIVEIILISSVALFSYNLYQNEKDSLKEHFLENRSIVCGHKEKSIIIKKDDNYTLRGDYFIKERVATNIDNCKSLEE